MGVSRTWSRSLGWWWSAVGRIEVVEGDYCSASQCVAESISKYTAVACYPPSGNQMIREPAAAASVEVVVPHAVPTRRGVDETSVTRVYSDMADLAALLEQ